MSSETFAYLAGLGVFVSDMQPVPVFGRLEEVVDFGESGETKDLIDVTNFDRPRRKTYITGLEDGDETAISCNEILDAAENTVQQLMIAHYKAGDCIDLVIVFDDEGSAEVGNFGANAIAYAVEVLVMSYKHVPSTSDAAKLNFTVKIQSEWTETALPT